MHSDEAYVLQALCAEAAGYVLKESTCDELVRAIAQVRKGRRFLSPPLSERAMAAYVQMRRRVRAGVAQSRVAVLTHLDCRVPPLPAPANDAGVAGANVPRKHVGVKHSATHVAAKAPVCMRMLHPGLARGAYADAAAVPGRGQAFASPFLKPPVQRT